MIIPPRPNFNDIGQTAVEFRAWRGNYIQQNIFYLISYL